MKFKKGDRVKRVKEGYHGILKKGVVGTIRKIDSDENVFIKGDYYNTAHYAQNLQLVKPSKPQEAVDYHENIYIHIKKDTLKFIVSVIGFLTILGTIIYTGLSYASLLDAYSGKPMTWETPGLILLVLVIVFGGISILGFYINWLSED